MRERERTILSSRVFGKYHRLREVSYIYLALRYNAVAVRPGRFGDDAYVPAKILVLGMGALKKCARFSLVEE